MPAKIDTIARRRRLPTSTKPVWDTIGNGRSGLKLGYRKGAQKSVWVAKLVTDGHRIETTLGPADDNRETKSFPANTSTDAGLSHAEATAAATAWAASKRQLLTAQSAASEHHKATVAYAIESYVKGRVARAAKAGRDAVTRLARHVLADAAIANLPVSQLTAKILLEWRERLPATMSPAGVNRLINDLKAALNAYMSTHWRDLPPTLGKEIAIGLKALPNAESARQALLSDADVCRIIDAAYEVDADLGAMVLVLASTGTRFSQAARITVADLQIEASRPRLMVPVSAKGNRSKQRKFSGVPIGSDVAKRLAPLTHGRNGHEPLLMRWVMKQVGRTEWQPVKRTAWANASEMTRTWKKALALAGLPMIEPLALRHSNIVRGLRAGLPVRVVAGTHDTSTAMIERHYAAFILDAADELMRRALIQMVTEPVTTLSSVA